ncbi:TPA: hypothetical protein HA265_06420 [Candidatus Woesearchaeota archaeon]|nr:hypothetical protein [Candidatus Woesearchaeota archaeon]
MIALFIMIASAATVSSQSNLNCSVFNRSEVPVDFVPLINLYQENNSHAEYGNLSNYNYTVACKSDLTTLGYGCSNNYIDIVQLYNYTNAHVSVDNYYSRSVCLNTSDSSLLWQVYISTVGNTPADYECVFSIFNYSNSHVYTCNNTNASYNVNIGLATAPSGSIVIYGPNGTELTGTRNVHLNLTFSDSQGVASCRWANDAESNLNASPWENCTTIKEWILSEGEGNKTVYYEIKNILNITSVFNDSIIYRFTQDYTPPSPPVIYDGLEGDDIDWWNSNTTLNAHWFNASDDISDTLYYRYRILENGSCYNNDCNFTNIDTQMQVSVSGLTLRENSIYSFEVEVYNAFNFSSSAISNGTNIDITPPDTPVINSSSHPDQNMTYAIANAEFNWTAEDILSNGNMSGIEGYSFILDSYPGTAPDNILENREWETLSTLTNNGYGQLLRGNGSVSSPHTYAVFKQLHTNLTENDSISVRVDLAELSSDYDDLMGVEVYLMKNTEGASITGFSHEGDAISNINNVSQDIRYAADMTLATTYQFNLTVNETVDDNTDDIYIVVSGITGDNDNRNNLSIAGSTTIDTSISSFLCDNEDTCTNVNDSVNYAIEVKRQESGDDHSTNYYSLGDGTYYFHVKAKDVAGNWGETEHYTINIATGGVSVAISSPADGQIFLTDTDETNISVKALVSGNASTYIVALHPDGSNHTSPEQVFSTTKIFDDIRLEIGTNQIYAVATNAAGVTTTSSSVYVIVAREETPITNRTLRVSYSAAAALDTHICGADEGSAMIGMATENDAAPCGGTSISADTSMYTIKIFATRPDMDVSDVEDELDDDDFLDQRIPSFGYGGDGDRFIVQNELRYDDVYIAGTERLAPGKYTLYINHHGVTPDGRVNLSITIG